MHNFHPFEKYLLIKHELRVVFATFCYWHCDAYILYVVETIHSIVSRIDKSREQLDYFC